MKQSIGLLVMGLLLCAACSKDTCGKNKEAFLSKYAALLEEARKSELEVGSSKWEQYDEQFRALVEECYQVYEGELSKGEKRIFWAQSVEYYYYRYGGGVLEAVNERKDGLSRRIRQEVESRWDRTGDALDEAMMSLSRKLQKAKERINN